MASRYTDVDLMILKRWDEVKALREAFDDLVDRMQDMIEAIAAEGDRCRNREGLLVGLQPQATIDLVLEARVGEPKEGARHLLRVVRLRSVRLRQGRRGASVDVVHDRRVLAD